MESIIEYRTDVPAKNEYPQHIVSPPYPSACCTDHMEQIGDPGIDADWRFYYKRCTVCGYTVRCFYAPSLVAVLKATQKIRRALAEMNLGIGKRKRRTRAEIDAEIAAAERALPGEDEEDRYELARGAGRQHKSNSSAA
jgi:hypothetical protein